MAVASFSPDGLQVVQGKETITLLRRGSDAATITGAKRRSLSTPELTDSDGKYLAGDVRFHWRIATYATAPLPGDRIRDAAGEYYTILDQELATLKTRRKCNCRNLRVVYGLNDTITILRAVYQKDTGGAAEPKWRVWRDGVRGRIQPLLNDMGVEHEARRTIRRVAIFIEPFDALDRTVKHDCRIRAQDGTLYKVTDYDGEERIGELATIHAEVTPWPLA